MEWEPLIKGVSQLDQNGRFVNDILTLCKKKAVSSNNKIGVLEGTLATSIFLHYLNSSFNEGCISVISEDVATIRLVRL